MRSSLLLAVAVCVLVLALSPLSVSASRHSRHQGRRHSHSAQPTHSTPPPPPTPTLASDPVGPDAYCVTFTTNVASVGGGDGPIVIEVTRALAPLGSDRLFALLKDEFFTLSNSTSAFFRVVPKFVVQFGISGVPSENTKWSAPIPDDPVRASNTVGSLTFATGGPNTRTTQLFINYANNSFLDSQGFAPFGTVVAGMGTAQDIVNPTPGSSDGIDQDTYATQGEAWIEKAYPTVSVITGATVINGTCSKA